MTDYNALLILGGVFLLAAVYIPETYFRSAINRLITMFFGFSVVMLGMQELGQTLISSDPSPLVFAHRWFLTTIIISSYLIIAFLVLRKLIQLNRATKAS